MNRRLSRQSCGRLQYPTGRREFLRRAGGGLGMIALADLLYQDSSSATTYDPADPLAARASHFPAKAKSVIWLFMNGGPSHVDTFDFKPALEKYDGRGFEGYDKTTGFFQDQVGPLMKSPFAFQKHGQCGAWVSELFPKLSQHVDKMAFLKSFHTESNNHSPALFMINSGMTRMGFPCVGSWVTYGLGTVNQNLPSFVVMSDPLDRGLPKGYSQNWGSGFLPGVFQGTWLRPKGEPIPNLRQWDGKTRQAQRSQLDLLAALNGEFNGGPSVTDELSSRIKSFELAYRMQSAAPEAFDVESEPANVKALYGVGQPDCNHFAVQCLLARRMIERGVRFVQIYSGGEENEKSWDGHTDIVSNHTGFAKETDQPIAGLLTDLQQRGLLEETLVIWGGEFGRLPISQRSKNSNTSGRDHNPNAGVYWLAGGGVKGGTSYGETDEVGFKAEVDPVHVNDLHATILHLLGLDHTQLTYLHNGRRYRLTDVAGQVVSKIVA